MDDITKWRKRIDEIDTHLLSLMNERATCAVEIGKIKRTKGMEIYNPVREKRVIQNICQQNKGPLADTAVQRLFEHIIEECKNIEKD